MSNIIQVAGLVAIVVGACLISIPVGLIVGGILTVILGIALERD